MKNLFILLLASIIMACSSRTSQPGDAAPAVDTLEKTNTRGFNPEEKPIAEKNNMDGTYRLFSNELKIKTINTEVIEITLCIGSEDCEMGCSTASFTHTDLGYQGELKDFHPDALFIITVNDKKVTITTEATDLEDHLGATCFITGEYK